MLLDGEVTEELAGTSRPGRVGPGAVFDVTGIVLNVPVRATFACLTDCTILAMSAAQFRQVAGHAWTSDAIAAHQPALATWMRMRADWRRWRRHWPPTWWPFRNVGGYSWHVC
jgi:CRP-like cAMP-binding protein